MLQIDSYRKSIEEIDKQVAELFQERMNVVSKIAEYKKINNLPIFDNERELILIKKNRQYIDNPALVEYYEKIFKMFLEVSKQYQEEILK